MKKYFACIIGIHNSEGFTLVSALFSLTILLLIIPFLSIILQFARDQPYEYAIDAEHFFVFLRDDLIESHKIDIRPDMLTLTLINGNKASYHLYNDVVRRRVQEQGHEIYIRNIRKLSYRQKENRLLVQITTENGENYEREFNIYE